MLGLSDESYKVAVASNLVGERDAPNNPIFQKSGYFRVMLSRYLNVLSLCDGKTVLDVGSGLGWGVNIVSDKADRVYGIDNSKEVIKFCNDNNPKENVVFKCMDCRQLEFEDNSVDVVLLMEVIEHFTLEDGYKVISEISRVLTSTGVLVGTTYIASSEEDRQKCITTATNDYHFRIYTKEEISRLFFTFFYTIELSTINFLVRNPR